jgi:hypothetical protein
MEKTTTGMRNEGKTIEIRIIAPKMLEKLGRNNPKESSEEEKSN